MANIKWMTVEVNGDAGKLPRNDAWLHVDVSFQTGMDRREIQLDVATGRYFDRRNRAVGVKAVKSWHVPSNDRALTEFAKAVMPTETHIEQDNGPTTEQVEEAIAA